MMAERKRASVVSKGRSRGFFPVEPGTLADALQEFFQQAGLSKRLETFRILAQFSELFPGLSPFCQVLDYRDEVLFLAVSDPLYTLEIQKRIPEMINVYGERGLLVRKVKIRCSG